MPYGDNLELTLKSFNIRVADLARASGVAASTIYSIIRRNNETIDTGTEKKLIAGLAALIDSNVETAELLLIPGGKEKAPEDLQRQQLLLAFDLCTDEGKEKIKDFAELVASHPLYGMKKA